MACSTLNSAEHSGVLDTVLHTRESEPLSSSIYLKQTIEEFLDDLSAREPTPGGGSVAAVVVAMAAGLASMAARFSAGRLPDAVRIAETADALRTKVVLLAQEDARAYQEVLTSLQAPTEEDPAGRRDMVQSALSGAAEIPLAIAEAAAEIGQLAEELARLGNKNLRGDAITSALLAHAGAQACAVLVRINLRGVEDARTVQAQRLADAAADASRRALDGGA